MACDYIPIINFERCGLLVGKDSEVEEEHMREIGEQLYEALSTIGFAYLSGTGLPWEEIDEMNNIADEFYSLPIEKRNEFYLSSLHFGYDALGSIKVNPERDFDLHQGFRISGYAMADENTIWPDIPRFKDKTLELSNTFKRLATRFFKALGSGMNLKDPEYFSKSHSKLNQANNLSTFKTIYYAPYSPGEEKKENQLRLGEHSDIGSLTFLVQDGMGGLQVKNLQGDFVDARPIAKTILVNIGDQLQFWSGSRLKSTVHRVVPPNNIENHTKPRRCVAYFLHPDDEVLLEELEFKDSLGITKPKEEKPMTSLQYVQKRFDEIFY